MFYVNRSSFNQITKCIAVLLFALLTVNTLSQDLSESTARDSRRIADVINISQAVSLFLENTQEAITLTYDSRDGLLENWYGENSAQELLKGYIELPIPPLAYSLRTSTGHTKTIKGVGALCGSCEEYLIGPCLDKSKSGFRVFTYLENEAYGNGMNKWGPYYLINACL